MENCKVIFIVFMLFFLSNYTYAQNQMSDSSSTLYSDNKPVIQVDAKALKEQDSELVKKKSKKTKVKGQKVKKNRYLGHGVKKVFKKYEERRRSISEVYYYLKEPSGLLAYSDRVNVYHFEKQGIRQVLSPAKEEEALLHGTYIKREDGKIVVSGAYYKGLPHGRWERFTRDGFLLSKIYYDKGLPVGSIKTYHENKKLKAVTPIFEGRPHGFYIDFYPSGRVKTRGYYQYGKKTGLWTHYYDKSLRSGNSSREKEVQYPKDAFSVGEPFVKRAWSKDGKLKK